MGPPPEPAQKARRVLPIKPVPVNVLFNKKVTPRQKQDVREMGPPPEPRGPGPPQATQVQLRITLPFRTKVAAAVELGPLPRSSLGGTQPHNYSWPDNQHWHNLASGLLLSNCYREGPVVGDCQCSSRPLALPDTRRHRRQAGQTNWHGGTSGGIV